MSCGQPITADLTVNEVVRLQPDSLRVLSGYGIDTCCGGGKSLSEVAGRHGLDLDRLLAELSSTSCACQR